MVVRFFLVVTGLSFLAGLPGIAGAVSPSTWHIAGVEGWQTTERDSIGISSDGSIGVSWSTEQINNLKSFVVWDLLPDGDNVLVATGDGGKLYRVDSQGIAEEIGKVLQPEITALGRDGDGRVVLGASPDGAVYRLDKTLEPIADTPETYIWRILSEKTGGVLLATGNTGKVYRMDKNGTLEVVSDLQCAHVTGLEVRGDGFVATTSNPGRLVQLSLQGKVQVLYDGDTEELRSPVPTDDGTIFFLANPPEGGGRVHRLSPNGAVEVVWRDPAKFLYTLRSDDEGRLWITTGAETGTGSVVRVSPTPPREWVELITVSEPQVLTALVSENGPVWIGTGGRGSVYRIGQDDAMAGTVTSPVQDAGGPARWGALSVEGGSGDQGTVIETRSGNTRLPDDTWSAWASIEREGSQGAIQSPGARFLQWRVEIKNRDTRMGGVRVVYLPANRAPQVTSLAVSDLGASFKHAGNGAPAGLSQNLPGGVRVEFQPQSGRPQEGDATDAKAAWARRYRGITWEAKDPNGDELQYSIELRQSGETEWKLLAKDLSRSPWVWDSSTVPDGWYALRVRATDAPTNPAGDELSDYRHTNPFLVDNTPPQVVGLRFADRHISGVAEDSQSAIKMLEVAVDGKEWRRVFPEDGIPDTPREHFSTPLKELEPGEHVVLIRVFDLAGNPGTGRVSFQVP